MGLPEGLTDVWRAASNGRGPLAEPGLAAWQSFCAVSDVWFAWQASIPVLASAGLGVESDRRMGCVIKDAEGLDGSVRALADAGFARQASSPREQGCMTNAS